MPKNKRQVKREQAVTSAERKLAEEKRRASEAREKAIEAKRREDEMRRRASRAREDARTEKKEHRIDDAAKKRRLKALRRREREEKRKERAAYRATHPGFYDPSLKIHSVLAVILTVLAIFITLSFLLRRAAGTAGAAIADVLLGCFSYTAYLIPLFLLIHAALWRTDVRERTLVKKALCFLPALLFASVFAAILAPSFNPDRYDAGESYLQGNRFVGGGAVGEAVGHFCYRYIGMVGTALIGAVVLLFFLAVYFRTPIKAAYTMLRTRIKEARVARAKQRALPQSGPARIKAPGTVKKQEATESPATLPPPWERTAEEMGAAQEKRERRTEKSIARRRALFADLEESLELERQSMPSGNRGKQIFDFESSEGPDTEGDELFAPAAGATPSHRDPMRMAELDDFGGDGLTVTRERIRPVRVTPQREAQAEPMPGPAPSYARPAAQPPPPPKAPAVQERSEEEKSGMDYFRRITVTADRRETEGSPAPSAAPAAARTILEEEELLSSAPIAASPLFDTARREDAPATDAYERGSAPDTPPSQEPPTPAPMQDDLYEDPHEDRQSVEDDLDENAEAELPFTATSSLRADLGEAERRGLREPIRPAPAAGARQQAEGNAFRPIAEPDTRPAPASAPAPAPAPAPKKPKRPYQFPPVSLLTLPEAVDESNISAEVQSNAEKLVTTLENFKVHTRVTGYSRGPRITRYEVVPEAGVRVRTISSLVEDISMGLATSGIRIEAPIPGKSAVGIEVPNASPTIVRLRAMLDTEKFRNYPEKTVVCLGGDVTGQPVFCDLAKMPHMLVAGATGMGKSVCINSIITSILYKATPDDVKLIMIDPKKVEFGIYSGIPHLLVPVVTDPKKAAGALSWAVCEMERRFDLIEHAGVRDIKSYNRHVTESGTGDPLPKIIIIIDELHDLMMSAADAVETSIARIAAKARAAGIHLLIGTQRPSVDVITGTIKANIPSRIAFHVSSQVDSRTILDFAGAEKLLAHGDMLYAPVGMSKPQRVQGAFVEDKEIDRVVEFLKANNDVDAEASEMIMADIEREAEKCTPQKKNSGADEPSGGGANIPTDADDNHLQWAALEVGFEFGKMSTSLLQRKLSIGYGKAAKILDALEDQGYISAQEGSKPREIRITREEFKEMMARTVEETCGGNF